MFASVKTFVTDNEHSQNEALFYNYNAEKKEAISSQNTLSTVLARINTKLLESEKDSNEISERRPSRIALSILSGLLPINRMQDRRVPGLLPQILHTIAQTFRLFLQVFHSQTRPLLHGHPRTPISPSSCICPITRWLLDQGPSASHRCPRVK